jgi:hypothetical protein
MQCHIEEAAPLGHAYFLAQKAYGECRPDSVQNAETRRCIAFYCYRGKRIKLSPKQAVDAYKCFQCGTNIYT